MKQYKNTLEIRDNRHSCAKLKTYHFSDEENNKKRFFKDLRTILGKEPVCDIIEVAVTGKIKNRVEGK